MWEKPRRAEHTPGEYAAVQPDNLLVKYCLVPTSETQKMLYEKMVNLDHGDDILHLWLQNFHAAHEAEYVFQVQLCQNLDD